MSYEQGGVVATMIIVGVCLSVSMFAMHQAISETPSGKGSGAGGSYFEHDYRMEDTKSVWSDYYKNNINTQPDCKKTAYDLQDFYDCVNAP